MIRRTAAYATLSALLALLSPQVIRAADAAEFFETRIRPLLAKNCFSCHTGTRMGGLQLDSRESMLRGGASGPAIVPGDAARSLLIQAVSHTHERLKMPPPGKLTDEQIGDLTAWVKAGAVWPDARPVNAGKGGPYRITAEQRAFWSFRPVRKPDIPAVRNSGWAKNDIDRFILAALESKGLEPVRPASRRVQMRRAYFDLIGLPPAPEEVQAFERDPAPDAFAKVVDRLLASPHYGERWARYWLDVARYSDDRLSSTKDDPYPNAYRYRDWVAQAFNDDMPYGLFVKAQIAGDLMEDKARFAAGLGFYALSPDFQDERVDATTRGFLGLTVACAQCHDHKYDPIPTKDFYSLQGVFSSSEPYELPFAPDGVVDAYQVQKKKLDRLEKDLKDFLKRETAQMSEILASQTARYLMAARQVMPPLSRPSDEVARATRVDRETLDRWVAYLKSFPKEHRYLDAWDALIKGGASDQEFQKAADEFQSLALAVTREKKETDAAKAHMDTGKTLLWKDLYFSNPRPDLPYQPSLGVLYNGEVNQYPGSELKVIRFLDGDRRVYVDGLMAEIQSLKNGLPPKYQFLHTIRDAAKPSNLRVAIGGNAENPGEEAPRRFLSILSEAEPPAFQKGSGRLELAEAIASPNNPLTARVMANRIWHYHFGAGIVRSTSNFGQLGERPTHPELLDYLASRFIESKWSVKAMHREIMLSATYALSSERSPKNAAADSDNRLLWRANLRRLDAEALRDTMLWASGKLDRRVGGPPVWLTENFAIRKGPDGEADKYFQPAEWISDSASRRSLYGFVSRRRTDATMTLFDFPNPAATAEQRFETSTPLQRLFFLNSDFVIKQAEAFAARVAPERDEAARIRKAYHILFSREPLPAELQKAREFLAATPNAWPEYAQVLMSSNEFLFVK
jgi:mono/diheme cytochrome c family protein